MKTINGGAGSGPNFAGFELRLGVLLRLGLVSGSSKRRLKSVGLLKFYNPNISHSLLRPVEPTEKLVVFAKI